MIDIEERVAKARRLFKEEGYNCCQAVVLAYCDVFGLDEKTAASVTSGFGGGMGRMREVCGTVSGMTFLSGLINPADDPSVKTARTANYALVQELAQKFIERNGSLKCADLLGLSKKEPVVSTPEARTEKYYAKRPCAKMVEEAARIWCEYIEDHADRGEVMSVNS